MTRLALVSIVFFLLVGALFHLYSQDTRHEPKTCVANRKEPTPSAPVLGTAQIVYSTKLIEKGKVFDDDCLKLRTVTQDKVPQDALNSEEVLIGRRAAFEIQKNQIVSIHDINKDDLLKWNHSDQAFENMLLSAPAKQGCGKVLYAIRDIPAGSRIDGFSVTWAQVETAKIPKDAAKSYKQIFGTVTENGLSQGQIILTSN